jgi:hypothetical protein
VSRFYPAPRVAPRRSHRTRARRAPRGPLVRPTPRRMRADRGTAVPRRNLRRHPVVTAGRAPYLKVSPSRAHCAEPPAIVVPPATDAAAAEL